MKRVKPSKASGDHPTELDRRTWSLRFVRNILIWLIPMAVLWLVLTPTYNRFLTEATENLIALFESPSSTRLQVRETHYFVINHLDVPAPKGWLSSVRVSDTHFPLILLGALFLAVPGVRWREKLEPLGWSFLISIFFHIISLVFWVQFVYTTQLGDWSLEQYGAFARNFWGLGKHLLDLPFKFALPLLLWCFFFLRFLLPERSAPSKA